MFLFFPKEPKAATYSTTLIKKSNRKHNKYGIHSGYLGLSYFLMFGDFDYNKHLCLLFGKLNQISSLVRILSKMV